MEKLNKHLLLITVVGALLFMTACDKVDNPYEEQVVIELDTTFYPGVWENYNDEEYPSFPVNTNTNVNVLVEDYTGHTCNNCPTAADIAHGIHENNPNRVFVASVHTDPGAQLSFQSPYTSGNKYTTDHTNPDGIAYGETFENGFNFIGNPQGTVNRKIVDDKMFDFSGTWQSRAEAIMTENDLKVNLQSVFNYYPSTKGGYLHVEAEKMTSENLELNTVVYVIQDSLVDWQLMPDNTDNSNYIHRDKHLGSIDDNPFGTLTFEPDEPQGAKVITDYSYAVPNGLNPENMHFLIYTYNTATYEIYQVIKQKLVE